MAINKKNRIQKELEELSWKFSMEAERLEKELAEAEDNFLEDDGEMEEVEPVLDEGHQREMESWYTGGDYGVNDMGRDAGIVFDEEKLQAARVTEWHKPPKIRESWLGKFFKSIFRVVSWPFRMVGFVLLNFFRGLYELAVGVGKLFYLIVRGTIVTAWQVVVAFKYAWIYLFGDLRRQEMEPVAVGVRPERRFKLVEASVWKPVVGFVLIALVLILPFQIYVSYNKAKGIKGEVLGASESGLKHLELAGSAGANLDLSQAASEFDLANQEFGLAEASVNQLGVVTNKLAALIPDVDAGQKLLKIARDSAQVGQHLTRVAAGWGGFRQSVEMSGVESGEVEEKISWEEMESELKEALAKTYEINKSLGEIDVAGTELAPYKPQIDGLKERMPQLLGWLEDARDVFGIVVHLMGTDEPRRWMLVFQNNSELRPTGGFMGSYAIMDTKDGKMVDIQVPGGGFYDLKGSLAVQVEAPYPFRVFSPIWQPWNANWFPDWPTTAEKIMWFYDKSGGPTVDGVIAFTPNVLEKLLALTGEIEMEEYGTAVNAENFVRMAQIEVELEYDKEENQPKKFIGDLMPLVLERVMEVEDEKLFDLWQVVSDSLKEKQLLVYLADEELETKVEDFGWAGEVAQAKHDYLMVVQTNVAGGKTDRVVKVDIEHEVEVLAEGVLIDTVTLTKTHEGLAEDVFEGQVNSDYVRFYVPEGSRLLDAEGFDGVPEGREFQMASSDVGLDEELLEVEGIAEIDESSGTRMTNEFGKTVFGNWMQVAPGESKSVVIKYLLPFSYAAGEVVEVDEEYSLWDLVKQYFFGKDEEENQAASHIYSLYLQKQSGTNDIEFLSRVKLDEKWKIKNYLAKDGLTVGEGPSFAGNLDRDEYYGVVLINR